MTKTYLAISIVIFGLVALGHLARVLQGWQAKLGPYDIPMYVSWGGLVAAGILAIWGATQLRR